MAGGRDGASEGVAGDEAATAASERLLHIHAGALLREVLGCCGRAAGGGGRGDRAAGGGGEAALREGGRGGRAGGEGRGGHAGAAGHAGARSVSVCGDRLDPVLEWVPPFLGGGEIPFIEGMERDF
jgi:hypothetical protein